MMLASPHTLAPMLMRGNIPPTTTNNPPRSARTNGAGEARRRGGRRRGRAPSAGRHRPLGMLRSPAPAPAPSPATRHSPQCTLLQTTQTAGNPHTGNGQRPEDAHATSYGRPSGDAWAWGPPRASPEPGTGKGASAGTGPPVRTKQPAAGRSRESPPQPTAPPPLP